MRESLVIFVVLVTACGGSGANRSNLSADDAAVISIYEVQGNGATSPLIGQTVTIIGIVTGDFQNNDADDSRNLDGFYLQDTVNDADPATSDGIFVFDGSSPTIDVATGDRVSVEGMVSEYFGETQITAAQVTIIGSGKIDPVNVILPAAALKTNSDGSLIADLERFEGMLIRLPQALTVTSLYNLERYGEVGLAQGGRPYQFTNQSVPDIAGYTAHREALAARSLLLDDGRKVSYATPIAFLTASAAADYSIRSGDQVTGLIGVLRFSRGSGAGGSEAYRLMPTADPQFESQNPRPGAPDVNGALRIVSFNALNFFSTIDTGQSTCGPSGSGGCRGADSTAELDRQLSKLVTTLDMLDADIVGLIEIENNAGAALQIIVDTLNLTSSSTYDYVRTAAIGSDVITTGFLFKTATVSLNGPAVILDSSVDAKFNDGRNRPALAQSFVQTSNNAVLSVVINHLKSKGSSCDDIGDPDLGDGQGNCNATRTSAAAALADWVARDPTGSGDADYLIIGDFNAHIFEDPLTTLKSAGLDNLLETFSGTDVYSYVFNGQAGALDHAFASASLVPQVTEVVEWHINADEPPVRDYNLESGRAAALFDDRNPYRTSDHDPVIIGLDLSN